MKRIELLLIVLVLVCGTAFAQSFSRRSVMLAETLIAAKTEDDMNVLMDIMQTEDPSPQNVASIKQWIKEKRAVMVNKGDEGFVTLPEFCGARCVKFRKKGGTEILYMPWLGPDGNVLFKQAD